MSTVRSKRSPGPFGPRLVVMRVLVTGGTRCLGREVVPRCLHRGWAVRVMSRRPPPAARPAAESAQTEWAQTEWAQTEWAQTEWAQADLASSAGLGQAVAGADVVLHLASLPYRGR